MFYYTHKSRPDTHIKEEPKHHGEAPETQPEDSTPWPIPKALAQACGSSEQRHLLIPTGPVPLP